MKFKCDNLFLYVEGIQFFNGEYETTNKYDLEILNRYKDSISIAEETKEDKPTKAKETKKK